MLRQNVIRENDEIHASQWLFWSEPNFLKNEDISRKLQ